MKLDENIELICEIGAGGMGTVWRAKHALMQKDIAVKLLHKWLLTPQRLMRFRQEAQLASTLNHPNIVQVYSFGRHDELGPYIAMELEHGESLDRRLKRGPLHHAEFLSMFKQCCLALQYAHEVGVIHRDIKPGNIMLVPHGSEIQVKVGDFGIAKFSDDTRNIQHLTQTGELIGTPYYMSPESCLCEPVDARSDIYSLGCVMHEALTGSPPFTGDSACEIMIDHTKGHINTSRLNQIDPGLKEIVLTCLAVAPAERQQTMQDVYDDLCMGKPSRKAARPKGTGDKLKLRPAHIAIGLSLCALVLCAAVALTEHSFQSAPGSQYKLLDREKQLDNARSDAELMERASIWLQLGNKRRAYEDYYSIITDARADYASQSGQSTDERSRIARSWTDPEVELLVRAAEGCDSTEPERKYQDRGPWDTLALVLSAAAERGLWKITAPLNAQQSHIVAVLHSKADALEKVAAECSKSVLRDDTSFDSLMSAGNLNSVNAKIYNLAGQTELAAVETEQSYRRHELAKQLNAPSGTGPNFHGLAKP